MHDLTSAGDGVAGIAKEFGYESSFRSGLGGYGGGHVDGVGDHDGGSGVGGGAGYLGNGCGV